MPDSSDILWASWGLSDPARCESAFRLLIELGAQIVGADEGSLLVLEPEPENGARHLIFAMTLGNAESEKKLLGLKVPVGEGITGRAALTREVQVGYPVYTLKNGKNNGEAPEGDTKVIMAAPMLIEDDLIGVITAVSFNPAKVFTAEHAKLYGRLAAAAAIIVDQQHRLEALGTPNSQLPALTERERGEREIIRLALSMGRNHPERLLDTARLMGIVERLASGARS